MKKPNITVVMAVGIFLLLGLVAANFAISGYLSDQLQGPLTAKLRAALNQQVHIGQISTNFLNFVTLTDLRVESANPLDGEPLLAVRKVAVKYNLWQFLRHRDFLASIKEIVLVEPALKIDCQNFSWSGARSAPLPWKISVKNGQLKFGDATGKFSALRLKRINGSIIPGDRQLDFQFKTATNISRNDRITVSGFYDPDQGTLDGQVEGRRITLEHAPRWFDWSGVIVNNGEFSGQAHFHYSGSGNNRFSYDGSAQVSAAGLILPAIKDPLTAVQGALEFNQKTCLAKDLIFDLAGAHCRLSGSVENYSTATPYYDLDLQAAAFNLAAAGDLSGQKTVSDLLLKGVGELSIKMQGLPEQLTIKSSLNVPAGEVRGIPFDNLRLELAWQPAALIINKLDVVLAHGALTGSANLERKPDGQVLVQDLRASWKDFVLADLSPGNWSGTGNAQLELKGTWPSIQARGSVSLDKVAFKNRNLGTFIAVYQSKKKKLSFFGKRLQPQADFKGEIELAKDTCKLNNLLWNFSGGGKVTASGRMQVGAENRLNFSFKGVDLPGRELNIPLGTKDLDGSFALQGTVGGTLAAPVTDLKISGEQLSIGQKKVSLQADLEVKSGSLEITSAVINRTSRIWGKIEFQQAPYINLDFQPEALDLGLLISLAGTGQAESVSGLATGRIHAEGPAGRVDSRGSLVITDLSLGNNNLGTVQAAFNLEEAKFFQGNLKVQQTTGNLQAAWNLDLQAGRENDFLLKTDLYKFSGMTGNADPAGTEINGSLKLTGKLKINGQTNFTGVLSSDGLTYNGVPEVLAGTVTLAGKKLGLSLTLGTEYSFAGAIDYAKEPRIEGTGKINLADISSAYRLWRQPFLAGITGALRLEARINGLLSDPAASGSLAVQQGACRGFVFDSLTADWRAQSGTLYLTSAEVKRDREDYLLMGKIPYAGNAGWLLNINISQASLANAGAGFFTRGELRDSGLAGTGQAAVKVTGTRQDPVASGTFVINDFAYKSFSSKAISGEFEQTGGVLVFNSLVSEDKQGKLYLEKGSKFKFLGNDRVALDGTLGLRNININNVLLFGEIGFRGEKDRLDLEVKNLWVNQHHFTGEKLKVVYQPGELSFIPVGKKDTCVIGKVTFPAAGEYELQNLTFFAGGQETLSASGRWKYPESLQLYLNCQNQGVDAGMVSEIMGFKIPVTGQAMFELNISGAWKTPSITCSFHSRNGEIGNLDYDDFIGEFTIKDQVLQLQSARLSGFKRYDLRAKGSIPLAEEGAYDLDVSLPAGSLELLTILPDWVKKASGQFAGQLTVTGTAANPIFNGTVSVANGEVYPAALTKKITAWQMRLDLVNNRITVQDFAATMGGGTLQLNGFVTLSNNQPQEFDLTAACDSPKGISIAIPGFIDKSEIKGSLRCSGNHKNYQVAGQLTTSNTRFTYPPAKSSADGSSHDWLDYAVWDLEITGGDNTWYENDLVEANVKGRIKFAGPQQNLNITGSIEAVRGTLQYLGTDFRIREAGLDFYNNTAYLSGSAEAQVSQDTIVITIAKNKLEEIRPHFTSRSDPQLAEEKVLSRLVYGSEVAGIAKEDQNKVLVKEMLKIVDNTLNTMIIKPVVKKLGLDKVIDVVKIRTEVSQHAAENTQTPVWEGSSLSVGKYLNQDIYLGYNTVLQQGLIPNKLELKHQVEMDYHLRDSKYLKMRMDENERFLGIENQIRF